MSEPYRNIQAVVDLLEAKNVHVTGAFHDEDYSNGSDFATFEIEVQVPVHEPLEIADSPESV